MNVVRNALILLFVATSVVLSGCASKETHRVVQSQKVESYGTSYAGPRSTLVVGNFENRSNYMQGLFSSNIDRLGNQAKTLLKTHLQQTNRFKLVDRENMENIKQEANISGMEQKLVGARYAVTGAVTEFGRKNTGDHQFFGILGSGKTQTAYAKISLNIVDVKSSVVVFSVQGAGEYALSDREVLGFGSDAGYDATLNGKVLNFAMTEAVNELVRGIERGTWKTEE